MTKATMQMAQDYLGRIKELEKENAELKVRKHISDCVEYCNTFKCACMQLAQAKEIIKGLLSCCRNYPQENAEKVEQARQFIKEIEK